ncbi:ATP-binding protein [Bifidobacterium sp. SO1]|uniref:ATP-binding protein n=1 Tax=Bifidobacterium sp. SO1 TaxID=2809029 RepID=UPI001BDCFF61|nr:ATP-binding protein [Bifidobacterium sp. SO1]MBT1162968.1 ATP-binding protein [Bifidobacterium sp. SO1]
MIRLRGLTLTDAKNTKKGVIRFKDLPSGASVTGIYGQNGSGKTTVIIAIQLLKTLLEGESITDESVGFIRQGADKGSLNATFDTDLGVLLYDVVFERIPDDSGRMRVVNETLTIRPADGSRKRLLIDHGLDEQSDDMGLRPYHTMPRIQWRSIRSVRSGDELLGQEETLAWSEGRSFVFSKTTRTTLERISGIIERDDRSAAAKTTARRDTLVPLLGAVETLSTFARRDMRIVTTREGSSVSFDYTPLPVDGHGFDMLDISHKTAIPAEYKTSILNMVDQANKVMPSLVPGLHLGCSMSDVPLKDGKPGIEVFLYSIRNDVTTPLWAESEGIRRIMGILSLLIRMFNEVNVCIAIDEIDSGIFEVLLGSLLQVLATRGVGQLIFTAHNLRVLETLTSDSIVFSTTDPENRFTTIPTRGTNNLRDMYIGIVDRGTSDKPFSDRTRQREIALALTEAGDEEHQ